jgi:hypothetical protein
MKIIEPVARPATRAAAPELPRPERSAPSEPDHRTLVVIDHVRAHEVSCYWDHLECRWCCSR